MPSFKLYYWSMLPGRGEFPRLILEDTQTPYEDVTRSPPEQGGTNAAVLKMMRGEHTHHPVLAPPILLHDDFIVSQMPNVCSYIAEQTGLAPADIQGRHRAMQIMLTICDVLVEAHDTHHPLGKSLYYEDQKTEALEAARIFREDRLPRFIQHFEQILDHTRSDWLVGDQCTYVDLAMFQLLTGLEYAFPIAFARQIEQAPRLFALSEAVAARPNIAAYLSSERRLAFGEDGIFRRYPELDG